MINRKAKSIDTHNNHIKLLFQFLRAVMTTQFNTNT